MALVGRDIELEALDAALAAVRAGERRTIGLLGEPGIGKSALLDALAAAAERQGLLVLAGSAAEHERDVPFSLLVDALDDHVATMSPRRVAAAGPELAAVLPAAGDGDSGLDGPPVAPAERYRLHRALAALLDQLGRERPYALLLDDVHWADDASIEALLHLMRRAPRAPHVLAFAARPAELAPRVLATTRSAPGWQEIRPAPLDRDAARALLGADVSDDVGERLAGEAQGNPLFLLELAKLARDGAGGDGPLPATLVAAVGEEVARLPADVAALLDAAAVAGDPFDPELAAAGAGGEAAALRPALDALVSADLVRPTGVGPGFRFRHPLIRRAVYDSAPAAWRLAAHQRVAAALAARGADPVARAYHVEQFARTGDEEALALLVEAAESVAATSPAAAASHYAAALRLLPYGDRRRRQRLLAAMADALMLAGRLPESTEALDEAIALLGDDEAAERTALVTAAVQADFLLDGFGRARRRLDAILDAAPPDQRPWIVLYRALVAAEARDADTPEWERRGVKAARDDGRPELLLAVDNIEAGMAFVQGRDPSAALERTIRRFDRLDDAVLADRLVLCWLLLGTLLETDRLALAVDVGERALRLARSRGHAPFTVTFHIMLATVTLPRLELERSLEHLDAAEDMARLLGLDAVCALALTRRASLLALQGDRAGSVRAADESDTYMSNVESRGRLLTSCAVRNAINRFAHDPERMIAAATALAGPRLEAIHVTASSWPLLMMTRAAIALGRLEEAEERVAQLAAVIETIPLPAATVRAARARAELLLARGDAPAAAAVAREAGAHAEAHGLADEALGARLLAARALLAAGERDAGVAELRLVAEAAARAGALADRDAAARELRRAGARVRAEPRRPAADRGAAGLEALTPRERDIAQLVARGQTNREVAQALFLSEKTIENTLSRIYAKLGVRSRAELASTLA